MTMHDLPGLVTPLLPVIRGRADALDTSGEWPEEDLRLLCGVGLFNMALPGGAGGRDVSALEQHLVYETVARGSLSVALILSQRDAAIGLIADSNSPARDPALGACARGAMTTVGIAQLTTSRQGAAPALKAEREPGGYRVSGIVPWCTGAPKTDFIACGAATESGEPILFVLSTSAMGVLIDPPMPLVAMRSTWTTSIQCRDVSIADSQVLRQPGEKVLSRLNHLPLGQAFLAMGLCRSGLDLIREHSSSAALSALQRFESQLSRLKHRILTLCEPGNEAKAIEEAPAVRGAANDLALRIAHSAVALYKGTALLAGHPAQRLAREAMFLLVWSCPTPVIDCTVEILSGQC